MKLLDTDICIHLLNGREPALIDRFAGHAPTEIALCSVVKAELLFGARRSARKEANLARVHAFAEPLQSLPFDDDCAESCALIRAELASRGQPIGPNDTLIAAIALANACTLVTRNTSEFDRVTGLAIETW